MPINRELFQEIHDVISVRPDEHLQSTWEWTGESCGTVRCVAGWAVHLATGKAVYANQNASRLHPETVALARQHGIELDEYDDGLVPALAKKLLGIDDDLARRLFFYVPDEAAREVVRAFVEGRDLDAESILHDW